MPENSQGNTGQNRNTKRIVIKRVGKKLITNIQDKINI